MVIVLRHVPYEGPGLIEDMLEGRGLPYRIVDVPGEGVPLGVAGFTGIVSMGGPMSVNDGTMEIEKEKGLLLEAIGRGIPILGVCLGAQLIASAMGARVYAGDQPEVGWGEVTLTKSGMADPLMAGVDSVFPVLHWNGDTFDLPEGAVKLASSDKYENQAFRAGSNIYGMQFHMEIDEEMVREWVAMDLEEENGIVSEPEEILDGVRLYLDQVRFGGSFVIGRFLDLVAGRESG
ncbi:MAG: type 1 glutamine amidotransferase [bacterium]|nr:type 1 glutamine amidotransferase [bacterium]MDT8365475.1 type 1 glutamine amidotransferase [bacterium]